MRSIIAMDYIGQYEEEYINRAMIELEQRDISEMIWTETTYDTYTREVWSYRLPTNAAEMIGERTITKGAASDRGTANIGMGVYAAAYEAVSNARGRTSQSIMGVVYDLLQYVYDNYATIKDLRMYQWKYIMDNTHEPLSDLFKEKIRNLFKIQDRTGGQYWDDKIQSLRHGIYASKFDKNWQYIMENTNDFYGLIYMSVSVAQIDDGRSRNKLESLI